MMPRPARTGAARRLGCASLIGVAIVLGAAGCGGSGDDQAVKQTMQRFLAAVGRGDGKAACALVTPSGQAALAAQIAALTHATHAVSCELILTEIAHLLPPAAKQGLESVQVQKATVKGNTATVFSRDVHATKGNLSAFLSGSAPTRLVKVGGAWKVTN
jgi:hypothetical protein